MSGNRSSVRLAITRLAAWLIRALGATWRVRCEGTDPMEGNRTALGAMWHQDALMATWWFRDRGCTIPVSRSADGDWVTPIVVALGYSEHPPRGSSSRGGTTALRGLVRQVEAGTTAGILIDGPRGPARQSKIGIVSLARLTGTQVTPLAFSASSAIRLKSWDRTIIPLPFARVAIRFGEPMSVPADATPADEEALRAKLDSHFNAITNELEAEFNH